MSEDMGTRTWICIRTGTWTSHGTGWECEYYEFARQDIHDTKLEKLENIVRSVWTYLIWWYEN